MKDEAINSNLSSWIGVKRWCDFGANLVQHFMRRYSRYSRYRTKTHDKSTISHDISRYSRYQTLLSKLEEIICALRRLFQKLQHSLFSGCCVFSPRVILSLSNFSVEDPVCTLFDAASQFGSALLRSGWHNGKARAAGEWNLGAVQIV